MTKTKTKTNNKKIDNKKIKDSVEKIREECDDIEEEIEDKRGTTYGDPIVELY